MNVYLAVLQAYDVPDSTPETFYFGTAGYVSGPGDAPAHQYFEPRIKQAASMRRDIFAPGTTMGPSRVSVGDLVLLNGDGAYDYLLDYSFDGRPITIYVGDSTGAFPADFETLLVGTMEQAEFSRGEIRIKIRDRQLELEKPLQDTLYAGSNTLPDGLEGVDDLKGKPKPLCYGVVRNISPPCVNTSKLIYQVSGNAVASVDEVYDNGMSLALTTGAWAQQTSGVSNVLYGAAKNGDNIVVVGATGTIIRSTDGGVNWAAASTPSFGTSDVRCVAYSPTLDKWVAGGAAGKIAYSADGGDNWTQITGGSNPFGGGETVRGIAWGSTPAVFVAVGDAGVSATSSNGTAFTSQANNFGGSPINAVAWGRNLFVMGGGIKIDTSPDGTGWTSRTSGWSGTASIKAIAYGRGTYVVAGKQIATSPDGLTWTVQDAWTPGTGGTDEVSALCFGGPTGVFIGGGSSSIYPGMVVMSVDGGRTWTVLTAGFSTSAVRGVAADDADVVAVGEGGKIATMGAAGTYASEADLLDDDLAPVHGTYKSYPAGGLFRLGSPPAGQITADVTAGDTAADRTAAQVWTQVLEQAGLTSADWSADDVTDLDAANDAEIGYWSGTEPVNASEVLSKMASSVGAWWGVDRTGLFRIRRLQDPTSETAAYSFTADDMKRPLERISTADEGKGLPIWREVLRYSRNYTVQANGLAGGVTDARRADLTKEWREVANSDATVKTKWLLAREQVDETLLAYASDAATEAQRRRELRDQRRDRFEFAVALNLDNNVDIDIGDYVEITHPRFGLSAGRVFVVMTVEPDAANNTLLLGLWG